MNKKQWIIDFIVWAYKTGKMPRKIYTKCIKILDLREVKMNLTHYNKQAKIIAPHNEVGFCKPRSKGDNTPRIKAVFLCLPFLESELSSVFKSIMTVLFVGRNPIAPLRDIANTFNAVTRFFAKSGDGLTILSKGITV